MDIVTLQLWVAIIAIIPATLASIVTLIIAYKNKVVLENVHKIIKTNGNGKTP